MNNENGSKTGKKSRNQKAQKFYKFNAKNVEDQSCDYFTDTSFDTCFDRLRMGMTQSVSSSLTTHTFLLRERTRQKSATLEDDLIRRRLDGSKRRDKRDDLVDQDFHTVRKSGRRCGVFDRKSEMFTTNLAQ